MSPAERELRHWFGVMATGELAEREDHYPRRVAAGRMSQEEADTAIRIWRAIATLFAQHQVTTPLSWAELEHELARSFAHLAAKVEAKPGDKILRDRLGAVSGMLERVRWHQQQARSPVPSGAEGAEGREQGRAAA